MELIEAANDTNELLEIWEQMKAKSFLNYNVDIKKHDAHIEEFKALSLAHQKQHLCELLDKNQLYVNLSSLNDSDFACSPEEKKLTKDFYRDGNVFYNKKIPMSFDNIKSKVERICCFNSEQFFPEFLLSKRKYIILAFKKALKNYGTSSYSFIN